MPKFITKLLWFLIPLIFTFFIGEYYTRISNSYYYKANRINEKSDSIECLILGASHNWRAINPEYLDLSTATLANAGSSINMDFMLFDKYAHQLQNLKIVVFGIGSLLFQKNRDATWKNNYLFFNYYGINNYGKSPRWSQYFLLTADFKHNVTKFFYPSSPMNKFGYIYREGSKINPSSEKSLVRKKIKEKIESFENIIIEQNVEVLDQKIQYCLDRNISVVLLTTPKYITYNNMLKEGHALRDSIFAKYDDFANVHVWNDETIYENDPTLFYDIHHMNNKGAIHYSQRFDSLLNTIVD